MTRRTTVSEDKEFSKILADEVYALLVNSADADWVVDWIADTFAPDDIFDAKTLGNWAKDNGFIQDG